MVRLYAYLPILLLGIVTVPIPVSAIGFGPVSPSKPPPSLSPFSPQQPSQEPQQATQEILYSCVCDQSYCGNNAISGRFGQIKKDIYPEDLSRKYGPQREGDQMTGWICLKQGHYRCECLTENCGNDALEAKQGKIIDVDSVEKVFADFKLWRSGGQKTGWQCLLQEP